MHKKRAGNGSSPPPALHFLGFDDRIQQRQLLTGGAVQRFKALIHGCRVDISYPPCQFLFPCFGFGIVYDHMDRGHFSDSGHLLLLIASAAVKFYSEIADNMKSGAYLAGQAIPFSRPAVHIYYWLLWILATDRLCYMPGTNRASGLPAPNRVPDVLLMPIS